MAAQWPLPGPPGPPGPTGPTLVRQPCRVPTCSCLGYVRSFALYPTLIHCWFTGNEYCFPSPLFVCYRFTGNKHYLLFSLYFLLVTVILLTVIPRLAPSPGVTAHVITLKRSITYPPFLTLPTTTIDFLQHLLLIILFLRFHHLLDLFLQLLAHA